MTFACGVVTPRLLGGVLAGVCLRCRAGSSRGATHRRVRAWVVLCAPGDVRLQRGHAAAVGCWLLMLLKLCSAATRGADILLAEPVGAAVTRQVFEQVVIEVRVIADALARGVFAQPGALVDLFV